jgi:hypothetical protein
MLTFFRKIRKGLLEGGRASKYLLYAIGEILLVVIGILIALQINNWNEWRKDRIREKVVLQEIAKTLEANCELLNRYNTTIRRSAASNQVINSLIENNLPYSDTLDSHFHRARQWYSNRFVSMAGYEEFKNAGFDIVLSRTLKDEIINLFESTYPQTQETIDIFQDGYWHRMNEFSRNNFYGIYNRGAMKPVDFDRLVGDQYYVSTLKEYYSVRLLLLEVQQTSFDESQRVLQLIKDELGESED